MCDQILDIAAMVCLVLAAALSAAAGIGLLRFTDSLSRLHAATKPQIFGLLLVIAAVALDQRSFGVLLALVPVFVFQALTAPTAAHMVGRAAYRTGQLDGRTILVDELGPAVARATASAAQEDREQALAEERRDAEIAAEQRAAERAEGQRAEGQRAAEQRASEQRASGHPESAQGAASVPPKRGPNRTPRRPPTVS